MLAIGTLLATVAVSALVIRLASVAIEMTGLSRDSARFQAMSAFSGCGFTTSESESMVWHPVRRRIAMRLMLFGAIGLVSVVTSLMVSALSEDSEIELSVRFAIGGGGLLAIALVVRNSRFDRFLCAVFARILDSTTSLEVADYAHLLHLGSGWGVTEVVVSDSSSLHGKSLAEVDLRKSDITVLGMQRPGEELLAVPDLETRLGAGDRLVLYGRRSAIIELCELEIVGAVRG